MMTRRDGLWVAAALGLVLAACERQPEGPAQGEQGEGSIERLTQEMDHAIDRAGEVAQEQGNRFIADAEARLRQMRESLAEARKREDLGEEVRGRLARAADVLEQDIARLEGELRRLRDGGADAWRDLGPRVREAFDDLSRSFERFRQEYVRQRR
jgi:hypothetical protein